MVGVVDVCLFEWVKCPCGFVCSFKTPVFAVGLTVLWRKSKADMTHVV